MGFIKNNNNIIIVIIIIIIIIIKQKNHFLLLWVSGTTKQAFWYFKTRFLHACVHTN